MATNVGAVLETRNAANKYMEAYAALKIAGSNLDGAEAAALQAGVPEEQLAAARELIDRAATR